jgi:hypothetical protein
VRAGAAFTPPCAGRRAEAARRGVLLLEHRDPATPQVEGDDERGHDARWQLVNELRNEPSGGGGHVLVDQLASCLGIGE